MTDLIYNTHSLRPEHQLEYWAEVVCKHHTFLSVEKQGNTKIKEGFEAQLISHPLSQVIVSSALASASTVHHTDSDIGRSREQSFLVHLQHRGHSLNRHAGHEVKMTTGDFTICDSTRPYNIELNQGNEMLLLKIPSKLMFQIVPNIENLVGKKINGKQGIGAIASQAITSLWLHRNEIEPQLENQLVHNVLDLMAFSINEGNPQKMSDSTVRSHHLQRIKRFIEGNLNEANLSAPLIAEANKVSLRYLHQLFSAEDQTLARYILDRRLHCSRNTLSDPSKNRLSITEIAHLWGFKDSSHFSHRFKQHFGVSPTEYRLQWS